MFDVYEMYGSREATLQGICALLSSSLGLTFEEHESYYLGEYFLARGPAGQEITVESNQLEDEDGIYTREEEFPDYGTLVRLEYRAPALAEGQAAADQLSGAIEKTQKLILLQRNVFPAEDRPGGMNPS